MKVIPTKMKYTRLPPARFFCNEMENKEEANVGAIVRMPEPSICRIPLAVPRGPPSGTLLTNKSWIEAVNETFSIQFLHPFLDKNKRKVPHHMPWKSSSGSKAVSTCT